MIYYYPIDVASIVSARLYASVSAGSHTHYHKGWEHDMAKQFDRVFAGQIAQNYVAKFLRLNGAEVQEDETDFTTSDNFDLKIKGVVFDVKSSAHPLMPMQATLSTRRKKPAYFVFCRLDIRRLAIAVLGVVKAQEVFQQKYFVPKGETIPNTDLVQTFDEGSYCYTGAFEPLSTIIEWAVKPAKPAANTENGTGL